MWFCNTQHVANYYKHTLRPRSKDKNNTVCCYNKTISQDLLKQDSKAGQQTKTNVDRSYRSIVGVHAGDRK